jgi:hypothetical protein
VSNTYLGRVLLDIALERGRQTAKHGDQNHLPDGTGPDYDVLSSLGGHAHVPMDEADNVDLADIARARCKAASRNEGGDGSITFEHILTEEWAEALAEEDPAALRAELIQVAAVAAQWAEAIDRRTES